MKTVQVEFPLNEAVEVLRLLRSETACILGNNDILLDRDLSKLTHTLLSARERVVTSMEEVVGLEEEPGLVAAMAVAVPFGESPQAYLDNALARATTDASEFKHHRGHVNRAVDFATVRGVDDVSALGY